MKCQYHGCNKEATWIVGEIITNIDIFTLLVCEKHRPKCLGGTIDPPSLWNSCNKESAPYGHFGREKKDVTGNSYIRHWIK